MVPTFNVEEFQEGGNVSGGIYIYIYICVTEFSLLLEHTN